MKFGSRPLAAAGALALCAVVFLTATSGRQTPELRRQLHSPDPFERMLAALTLCEAHPRKSAVAIRVLFEAMRSDVDRNRLAAERALVRVAEYKLAALAEFLVVAGPTRPLAVTQIVPLLRDAGPGTGELMLQAWRRNDWAAPPELRLLVLVRAGAEPSFSAHLADEFAAAEGADRETLGALLIDAGPALRANLEDALKTLDGPRRAALELLLVRLGEGQF